MPPPPPPPLQRRHRTLKGALCVCNAATASELGFVVVFLSLFALPDSRGGSKAAYIPFVAVAALLMVTGAVLAKLVWRERIGTTVLNLVYSLFVAAAAAIIAVSNSFRPLFCAMGVAPLASCALSLGYLLALRSDKRERDCAYFEPSAASASREWDADAATAYALNLATSPTSSPLSTPPSYINTA